MQNKLWWLMPLMFTVYSFTIAYIKHDWLKPFAKIKLDREMYNMSRYLMASVLSMWVWYAYFHMFN